MSEPTTTPVPIYSAASADALFAELADISCFAPKWSSASTYHKGDVVSHSGRVWASVAQGENLRHEPSEGNWWKAVDRSELAAAMAKYGVFGGVAAKVNFNSPTDAGRIAVSDMYSDGETFVYAGGTEGIAAGTVYAKSGSSFVEKALRKDFKAAAASLTAAGGVQLKRSILKLQDNGSGRGVGIHSDFGKDGAKILFYGYDGGETPSVTSTFISDGRPVSTLRDFLPARCRFYSQSESYSSGEFCWYPGGNGIPKGQYVARRNVGKKKAFSTSAWACVNDMSTMFSSSNTALISDVFDGSSHASERIATVGGVDLAYPTDYVPIRVSVFTSDGSPVTGQTVSLYEGESEAGTLLETSAYEGAPVYMHGKFGMKYFVAITDSLPGQSLPSTASGTLTSSAAGIELRYSDISRISDIPRVLPSFGSDAEAFAALSGIEFRDTWTAEDGTRYDDPLVCTAVKQYVGSDGKTRRGAKMERKYATLHPIEFCTPESYGTLGTSTDNINGIATDNGGTFVAVAGHCIWKKAAGSSTWEKLREYADITFVDVVYMDVKGMWIAVSEDGHFWSYDGSNIANPQIGVTGFQNGCLATYGASVFAVNRCGIAVFTTNGWSWSTFGTLPSVPSTGFANISVAANANYVAVACEIASYAERGYTAAIYGKYYDGSGSATWIRSESGNYASPKIAYGNGKFVCIRTVTANGQHSIISATNPISTWTQMHSTKINGMVDAKYLHWLGNSNFIAVGHASAYMITDSEITNIGISANNLRSSDGNDDIFFTCCAVDSGTIVFGAYRGNTFAKSNPPPASTNGSNYSDSTIRQYLNSSATSGAWHEKKHGTYQLNPNQYSSVAGYCKGCSSELLANAQYVRFDTQKPTPEGGAVYTTTDRFFIDSATEEYGTRIDDAPGLAEGTYDERWKLATEFASPSAAKTNGRIKYAIEDHTAPKYIYLRTADTRYNNMPMVVLRNGSMNRRFANKLFRCTPCCVIW